MKVLASCIFLAFACCPLFAAEAPKAEEAKVDEASAKLWEAEIHNKPARVLDNWELCQWLRFVKEAGKIDNRLAVFATVAFAENKPADEFVHTEKNFIKYAQEIKGTALAAEEEKRIKELYAKASEGYGKRPEKPLYGTFLMGKALAMKPMLDETKGLKDMVEIVGKIHGWVATFEEGENIPFDKYKEAVHKRIPIILEKDKRYMLGIGYIEIKTKKYLVVADLSKTPLEKIPKSFSPSERDYYESLPPDNPRRKRYERMIKEEYTVVDFQVSSAKPLMPGITIEEFDKSRYKAYFIYDWRESVEAWKPEIEAVVGKEKKKEEELKKDASAEDKK